MISLFKVASRIYFLFLIPVFLSPVANALTSQTISGFAPATPILFSPQNFTLTATGGASGNPIVFASTSTAICTVSGAVVSKIAIGTCTLTANQAGNATYSAAPQVTKSVVINKGTQTITFAALANKTFSTTPFAVSGSASSGLGAVFSTLTPTVCSTSSSKVTFLALGTCTLAANQPGNSNYSAAAQVLQSFTVSKGSQTITFATLPGKGFGSAPFTVFATASSALAIAFTSITTGVCSVSGSTVTLLALGTCTVAANQAGNTNFDAAVQVTQSFTVTKGAQSISFSALLGKSLGSPPFTLSATTSSGLPITFSLTTTGVCAVSGSTLTLVATGLCTIAANQSGNANYNAATQVTQSFTVSGAASTAQTVMFGVLAGKGFGTAPFTVSATASSGLAVTFISLTASVCTVSSSTVTIIAVGTCTVAANQSGNATYSAAPQVTQSFSVSKGSQAITFAALSGKTLGNTPFPVSATASSGLAVAFTSSTTAVCIMSSSTVTMITTGTCTITANQSGNANYNSAAQVTQSFAVSPAGLIAQTITGFSPPSPIQLSNSPYVRGGTFTLTATGGASGKPVVFASTTPAICTVSGNTVTKLDVGTCTLTEKWLRLSEQPTPIFKWALGDGLRCSVLHGDVCSARCIEHGARVAVGNAGRTSEIILGSFLHRRQQFPIRLIRRLVI